MSDVTRILSQIESDPSAAEHLLPLVYEELRKLAAAKLACEKPGLTLQATALVHEAYIKLVSPNADQTWEGRGHFFAAAAEAMRRILVDDARRRGRLKRGGEHMRISILDADMSEATVHDELLAVDEALQKLAADDAAAADIVKLRYFAGLSTEEVAETLGMSRATAYRHWAYAKAWLRCELEH